MMTKRDNMKDNISGMYAYIYLKLGIVSEQEIQPHLEYEDFRKIFDPMEL